MLLDRHQLDGVVSQVADPGQHVVRELAVSSDALLILAHADMRFIDQRRAGHLRDKAGVRPLKRFRIPDLGAERLRFLIHLKFQAVSRAAGKPSVPAADPQLDELAVLQGILPLQADLPDAVLSPFEGMAFLIPFVEIAEQEHFVRAGQPLPENPSVLRPVEPEIQVTIGEVSQGSGIADQLPAFLFEAVHAQLDIPRMRCKPGIDLRDLVGGVQSADIHALFLRSFIPP